MFLIESIRLALLDTLISWYFPRAGGLVTQGPRSVRSPSHFINGEQNPVLLVLPPLGLRRSASIHHA